MVVVLLNMNEGDEGSTAPFTVQLEIAGDVRAAFVIEGEPLEAGLRIAWLPRSLVSLALFLPP